MRGLPQRNLAVEMLPGAPGPEGAIKTRGRKNPGAPRLENSIIRYQNRAVETAQVIEELIPGAPGHDLREADRLREAFRPCLFGS